MRKYRPVQKNNSERPQTISGESSSMHGNFPSNDRGSKNKTVSKNNGSLLDFLKPNKEIQPSSSQNDYDENNVAGNEVNLQSSRQFNARQNNQSNEYDQGGVLIDPVLIFREIWKRRLGIIVFGIIGAVLGVMLALSTPHKYSATSQVYLDPRELLFSESSLRGRLADNNSLFAIIDSHIEVFTSTALVKKVISDLNLTRDPEFGGARGGLLTQFTSKGGAAVESNNTDLAMDKLYRAMSVSRLPKTFVVNVSVTTKSREKSVLIANKISSAFFEIQRTENSGLFSRASSALSKRLADLRGQLETAELNVEKYRGENDLLDAAGKLISDQQIIKLNEGLATLRSEKVAISVLAKDLAKLNASDVISGSIPGGVNAKALSDLRASYASLAANAEVEKSKLGSRHPKHKATQAALQTVRDQIRDEVQRIIGAAQANLKRTIASEQQLASDLAVLKSRKIGVSGDQIKLRELEREAEAIRQIYSSFLKSAREAGEQQELNTTSARVLSEATLPLLPDGPSRAIISISGMMAGFALGFFYAICMGLFSGWQSANSIQNTENEDENNDRKSLPSQNTSRHQARHITGDYYSSFNNASNGQNRRYSGSAQRPRNDDYYAAQGVMPYGNEKETPNRVGNDFDENDRLAQNIREEMKKIKSRMQKVANS